MLGAEEQRRVGDAVEMDLFGVYHDRHARIEGRWWFTERLYHPTGRTGPGLQTYGFPSHLDDFL